MDERILHCIDICPLPQGCADNVRGISYRSLKRALREKKVIKDKREIGTTSVIVNITDNTSSEIASKGLQIDTSSVACSDMKERFNYVLRQTNGAMGGGLRCKYTDRVDYGSGISSPKPSQKPNPR